MWGTKSLSIRSVIANMAPKKYPLYYFDIIPAIRFLIGYCPFISHIAYALVKRYSTDNRDNNNIDSDKDKHIYRECIQLIDGEQ